MIYPMWLSIGANPGSVSSQRDGTHLSVANIHRPLGGGPRNIILYSRGFSSRFGRGQQLCKDRRFLVPLL